MCFIIYADKSKLSTFETKMGYPVMAKIANLPVDIRNGEGTGGACVVGWLPIVRFTLVLQNSKLEIYYRWMRMELILERKSL